MPTPSDTATLTPPEAAVHVGEEPTGAYVDQDREGVREPKLDDPSLDLRDDMLDNDDLDLESLLDLGEMRVMMSVDGEVAEGGWVEKALARCARKIVDSPEFGGLHIVNHSDKVLILASPNDSLIDKIGGLLGTAMRLRAQDDHGTLSFFSMTALGLLTQAMLKTPDHRVTYESLTDWMSIREETYGKLMEVAAGLHLTRPVEGVEGAYELTGRGILFGHLAPSGLGGLTRAELIGKSGMSESQLDKHLTPLVENHAVYQEEDRYMLAFDGVIEPEPQSGGLGDDGADG